MYGLEGKRIWIAGHRGMVGAALLRRLARERCEVVTAGREELDLTRQAEVERFVADSHPDAIILAAAKVGGIGANAAYPADFLYENLQIETNVIGAADAAAVERLLFLGSSCIYPRLTPQPIDEAALLTGPLEPTNEAYAIAKIAGIRLVQAFRQQHGRDYIAAMPTSLYGPGDNFDLETGHVLPALIRKAHEAKLAGADEITIWGSGTPRRELLHVDDCADALVFLLRGYSATEHINVGSGTECSIAELAQLVCRVVGFEGRIVHDRTRPDGTPRKLLNSDRLRALGWRPAVRLEPGIAATYQWYLEHGGKAA